MATGIYVEDFLAIHLYNPLCITSYVHLLLSEPPMYYYLLWFYSNYRKKLT